MVHTLRKVLQTDDLPVAITQQMAVGCQPHRLMRCGQEEHRVVHMGLVLPSPLSSQTTRVLTTHQPHAGTLGLHSSPLHLRLPHLSLAESEVPTILTPCLTTQTTQWASCLLYP